MRDSVSIITADKILTDNLDQTVKNTFTGTHQLSKRLRGIYRFHIPPYFLWFRFQQKPRAASQHQPSPRPVQQQPPTPTPSLEGLSC